MKNKEYQQNHPYVFMLIIADLVVQTILPNKKLHPKNIIVLDFWHVGKHILLVKLTKTILTSRPCTIILCIIRWLSAKGGDSRSTRRFVLFLKYFHLGTFEKKLISPFKNLSWFQIASQQIHRSNTQSNQACMGPSNNFDLLGQKMGI